MVSRNSLPQQFLAECAKEKVMTIFLDLFVGIASAYLHTVGRIVADIA